MEPKYYFCSFCGSKHPDFHELGSNCTYKHCPGKLIKQIAGRAHDSDQKEIIINRLLNAWCAKPNLRLSQLIKNTFGDKDIFYIEDETFIGLIESFGTDEGDENE